MHKCSSTCTYKHILSVLYEWGIVNALTPTLLVFIIAGCR